MVYYRRCKPSANPPQGFSKQETNNFLRSPATRGRELKHVQFLYHNNHICRPPRAGAN